MGRGDHLTVRNGRYHAVCHYKQNGVWKTKQITTGIPADGRHKKEAKAKADELISKFMRSISNDHTSDTLAEYAEYWLAQKKHDVRSNTLRNYQDIIRTHIVPLLGNIPLIDITQREIEAYIRAEQDECDRIEKENERLRKEADENGVKYKPVRNSYRRSIKKHVSLLSSILEFAANRDEIPSNPVRNINPTVRKSINVTKFHGTALNSSEIRRLIEFFRGDHLEPVVILGLHLGGRRSEALGLKWSNIDFKERKIYIRDTVVLVGSELEYRTGETKSDTSMDVLPMTDFLYDYLKELKGKQEQDAILFGREYQHSDYVCRWASGQLIRPNNVSQHFRHMLLKSDLPLIRFHDLRHTTGTLIWEMTGDIVAVQTYLRHANVSTTADIYTHRSLDKKREVARVFEGAINSSIHESTTNLEKDTSLENQG